MLLSFPATMALALAQPAEEWLDEVRVTGEQPGPAMWRVTKGDHTLWIMGTLSPVPAKMSWRARQAEAVIADSGEILGPSTASVALGTFTVLRNMPALLRLRHNADGATLREVLPPEVYTRWHAAHRRWFGKDPDPKERARPLYAAELLFEQALERSGLSRRNVVWPKVRELAQEHAVRIRQRNFAVVVKDPRQMIADIAALPRDKEAACLLATLDRIERDLPDMKRRAEAWAIGDLATLRAMPAETPMTSCIDAVLETPRLRTLADAQREKMEADWSGIIDWMLLAHQTSFTTLPLDELLQTDGPLAQLRARGYVVDEPQ